jgi:L-iditol 2-dehydrogenase
MKALVKTAKGVGRIQVHDLNMPGLPEPDWVVIKVEAAGVCGTDLHIWKDEFPYWPPVIMGHEFSGEVVEVGPEAGGVHVGDRVVSETHSLACGVCEQCRQGRIQICEHKRSPGWGIDGAFAEYVTMPAKLLHLIPKNVSFDLAALTEPMAIAVHQIKERGGIDCMDTVVVTGAGPVGILSVFVAREMGAGKIIVTGTNTCEDVRFPAAVSMGADDLINVETEDPIGKVMQLTDGRGADMVVETSGAPTAIEQSVGMLRKHGRISAIGLTGRENPRFPWNDAMLKVLDIRFNFSTSYTSWDRALALIANTDRDLTRLITHRSSLDNWESVFNDLKAEKGIKAIFDPSK